MTPEQQRVSDVFDAWADSLKKMMTPKRKTVSEIMEEVRREVGHSAY